MWSVLFELFRTYYYYEFATGDNYIALEAAASSGQVSWKPMVDVSLAILQLLLLHFSTLPGFPSHMPVKGKAFPHIESYCHWKELVIRFGTLFLDSETLCFFSRSTTCFGHYCRSLFWESRRQKANGRMIVEN